MLYGLPNEVEGRQSCEPQIKLDIFRPVKGLLRCGGMPSELADSVPRSTSCQDHDGGAEAGAEGLGAEPTI